MVLGDVDLVRPPACASDPVRVVDHEMGCPVRNRNYQHSELLLDPRCAGLRS